MWDYVDGKADWMAYGLPVEGSDGPFLGQQLTDVTTCDVAATVGDARRLLHDGAGSLVVVAGAGLAVGEVDAGALEGHGDDERILDVMDPVPTTVRPSVTVRSTAEAGGGRQLVTTSDGRLLGAVTVEPAPHDHDHAGAYEKEMDEVLGAIMENFGEREPSEEELRAFLHERLVSEGRSVEEADRFLEELDAGE